MPLLMITCPKTRRSIPTNLVASPAELAAGDPAPRTIGPCPYCKGTHTWTLAQAFPVGSRPQRTYPPPRAR
jgi:hypothetical protein